MNHMFAAILPHTPKAYYRVALMHFFFIMGVLFSSWAIRIPDIKSALALSDIERGGILFGAPVGQLLAIAPTAWLVGHIGSRRSITLGMCVMPTDGIFAVVLNEAVIRPGDQIEVESI